jgi:hypothetical protein
MEKIPNGRYTKEFREEAARLVIEIFYNRLTDTEEAWVFFPCRF